MVLNLLEDSDAMRRRVRLIRQQSVTFRDFFVHCLDWQMLGRFAMAMVAFLLVSAALFLVFLLVIYFADKDQWHEYFPPPQSLQQQQQQTFQENFGDRQEL